VSLLRSEVYGGKSPSQLNSARILWSITAEVTRHADVDRTHSRPDGESGLQTVHCAPRKGSLLIHTLRPVAKQITHEFVIFISAKRMTMTQTASCSSSNGGLRSSRSTSGDYLFESRGRPDRCISTRQYSRLVSSWIAGIGVDPRLFGTHSLRRQGHADQSTDGQSACRSAPTRPYQNREHSSISDIWVSRSMTP
jgi:hypothetical protein